MIDATADTALASAIAPGSQPVVGAMIDHYTLAERLGAGGMGVVYRAVDTKLGREVALKVLREHAPGTDSCGVLCQLLLREARTMARLSHPNIVSVHDTGRHGGCVYVVMELVRGTTLREWARQRSFAERMNALLEAGEGLAAAHAAGVVHRDVKPDNMLVGDDGRVRVTDFGIARSAADLDAPSGEPTCGCGTDDATAIAATEIAGTPAYMSPQQLRGEPADGRCDQFAFAVTAWEVLFGEVPFGGDTPAARLDAIAAQTFAFEPEADAPTALVEVLRRALRSKSDVRYPSVRALLNAMRASAPS